MSESESPAAIRNACAILRDEIRQSPDAAAFLVEQILAARENDSVLDTKVNPGFARFIGWRTLETVLRPWIESFAEWRDDVSWIKPYCPFCGSLPAMAQLVRTKKGRERLLSCGCCRSRWSYPRTGCLFCGNNDQDKLEILELEREEPFRIDVCRECSGYLKTYAGEGEEELLLADWSTLHLDILAVQEGFQRRAGSLYEL
jgi:FdhE protein